MSSGDPPPPPAVTPQPSDQELAAQLLQIARAMHGCTSPAQAMKLLRQGRDCLGADAAIYVNYIRDDATLSSYQCLLACDPCWGVRYGDNCAATDTWLQYAMYNTRPIVAGELDAVGEPDDAAHLAREHGFRSALLVPVATTAAQSHVGMLCLGSNDSHFFSREENTRIRTLARVFAMELADWIHRHLRSELMATARITQGDLDLLQHEQQGHGSKVAAAMMNITPTAFDLRFHRLCRRLGTPDRKSAVRLAEIYGLI